MKRLPVLLSLTAGASLCACSSISGLDATSEYACKAPEGVRCESVSGTYHNALQNNLPAQRQRSEAAPASEPAATSPVLPTSVSTPIASPIRSQPKVLRLWIKPWEDADRDLHDEGYVYVQIDSGRWLVERAQRPLRDAYAPIRAPRNPVGAPGADAKAAAARQPAVPAGASSPVAEALRALQSGSAEGER